MAIRKRTWTTTAGETKTAWVADYSDQNRKRHIKTFPTKKAADTWLLGARGQVRDGIHTPESTSITVAEAVDLWLRRGEMEELERSSLRVYRIHARLHINPPIGDIKFARLSTPNGRSVRC